MSTMVGQQSDKHGGLDRGDASIVMAAPPSGPGGLDLAGFAESGGVLGLPCSSQELLQRVLSVLRGRYVLICLLTLMCASSGAVLGWRSGVPVFVSEGLVRIAYTKLAVLSETDQNRPIAMYDAFIRSQQLQLTSRPIVEKALETDIWKATGRGRSLGVISQFAGKLKAERPPGTENLRVTFSDEDPQVCSSAVGAVIRAYEAGFKGADAELQQRRLHLLQGVKQEHVRTLDKLTTRMAAVQGDGAGNVEQLHAAAVQKLVAYESRLADVEMGLALSRPTESGDASRVTTGLTDRQIGMMDPNMRGLLNEQERLEAELQQMELRLGSEHGSVIAQKQLVGRAKTRVAEFAKDFRESMAHASQQPGALQHGPMSMFLRPVESLKADQVALTNLVTQTRAQAASLASRRDEAVALKGMIAKLRQSTSEVEERIAMLSLELELGDRLEVVSRGEVPLVPFRDTRNRLAVTGAMAGACAPLGLIAMLGLLNFRYRFSDDASSGVLGQRKLPLLGVLPTLPDGRLMDLERAADAAQCLHQIRVMLQARNEAKAQVYLISSTSAQEGKTSLCVALGMSFAASGSRTLLIDADLVGRGLTRGLRAENLPGLRETLETGRLTLQSRPDGLSVLTAGRAKAADACKISVPAVRRLIAEVRKHFDTVLIDSGPILGSVEAAIVAREVDGVIMTISRGQSPTAVERSLRYLDMIRANVVGTVFNRAQVKDFYRSFQRSSVSTEPGNFATTLGAGASNAPTMFGPLVCSVASSLPAGANVR